MTLSASWGNTWKYLRYKMNEIICVYVALYVSAWCVFSPLYFMPTVPTILLSWLGFLIG